MNRPHAHSATLQHRINAYALTATAAGVGLLALAPFADAKVVYTPTQVNLTRPHSFYQLDLNHDGVVDFTLANAVTTNTDQFFWQLFLGVPTGNAVVGTFVYHGFPIDPRPMRAGSKIGPGLNFYKSRGVLATVYYGGGGLSIRGEWPDLNDRYLGLKFQINGETHYGWARMNVLVNTTKLAVFSRLTGYAYETDANTPIIAGQTHDNIAAPQAALAQPPVATVQPVFLGALALGSNGITIWRRDPEPDNPIRT